MRVRANTIVRKSKRDKKNTTCKHCGHKCSTPQKLCEHFERKNLCKPITYTSIQAPIQASASIQIPIQASIQEAIQTPV